MTDWDERWMSMCDLVATWSKDKSRQTSAIIVNDRQCIVSLGWNGFPRNIDDNVEERHERPAKYQWTEHAERNAIYNAAANGHSVSGCRMYLPWFPCADCGRAIVQSGITQIICVEPDWNDPQWGKDFLMVYELLKEAGVDVAYMNNRTAPVQK